MERAWLIIGLGNNGDQYKNTVHNVGFEFIDYLREYSNARAWKLQSSGMITSYIREETKVFLFKPSGFINVSGAFVRNVKSFYNIPLSNIVVIHDDTELSFGTIKVKKSGGHGGHNGIKSIDAMITRDYWRLRIGVGKPANANKTNDLLARYVLSKIPSNNRKILNNVFDDMASIFPLLMQEGEKGCGAFTTKLALLRNKK